MAALLRGTLERAPSLADADAELEVRLVDLTVTDTQTGASKTYVNPLGKAYDPIQDVNAFLSCTGG